MNHRNSTSSRIHYAATAAIKQFDPLENRVDIMRHLPYKDASSALERDNVRIMSGRNQPAEIRLKYHR